MAVEWEQIEALPEFQSAPPDKKRVVRELYFNTYVADQFSDPQQAEQARQRYVGPYAKMEQIEAEKPSFMRDVVQKTAQDIGQGTAEGLKNIGHGVLRGTQGFYGLLDDATDIAANLTGTEKGGVFEQLEQMAEPPAGWEPKDIQGQIMSAAGQAVPDIANLVAGTKYIPGGLSATMALHEAIRGGAEDGVGGAAKGAVHGGLLGATLKGAELLPPGIAPAAMAGIFGGDTALQGGSPQDVLVNTIVGGGLGATAGKRKTMNEIVREKAASGEMRVPELDGAFTEKIRQENRRDTEQNVPELRRFEERSRPQAEPTISEQLAQMAQDYPRAQARTPEELLRNYQERIASREEDITPDYRAVIDKARQSLEAKALKPEQPVSDIIEPGRAFTPRERTRPGEFEIEKEKATAAKTKAIQELLKNDLPTLKRIAQEEGAEPIQGIPPKAGYARAIYLNRQGEQKPQREPAEVIDLPTREPAPKPQTDTIGDLPADTPAQNWRDRLRERIAKPEQEQPLQQAQRRNGRALEEPRAEAREDAGVTDNKPKPGGVEGHVETAISNIKRENTKLENLIKDWSSRKYKKHGGKVKVGTNEEQGDTPWQPGEKNYSVDYLNEKRRSNNIRNFRDQIEEGKEILEYIEPLKYESNFKPSDNRVLILYEHATGKTPRARSGVSEAENKKAWSEYEAFVDGLNKDRARETEEYFSDKQDVLDILGFTDLEAKTAKKEPKAEAMPEAKEPWQMTRDEFGENSLGGEAYIKPATERKQIEKRREIISEAVKAEESWYQTQETSLKEKIKPWIEGKTKDLPHRIYGNPSGKPYTDKATDATLKRRAQSLANKNGVSIAAVRQNEPPYKSYLVELPVTKPDVPGYGVEPPISDVTYKVYRPKKASPMQIDNINKRLFEVTEDSARTAVIDDARKPVIQKALSEGRDVPPEVLKDYPDLAQKAEPELKSTAEEVGTTLPDANRAYENNEVPEGWYVHGRAGKKDLDTGNVLQLSKDWSTAEQYAGKKGSMWMMRPSSDAKVFDATSKKERASIRKAIEKDYNNGDLPVAMDEAIERAGGIKEAFPEGELNPKDIVNSAAWYDEPAFGQWLYDRQGYDFVKTENGGVAIDPSMTERVMVGAKKAAEAAKKKLTEERGSVLIDLRKKRDKHRDRLKEYPELQKVHDSIGDIEKNDTNLWAAFQTKAIDRFDALSRDDGKMLNTIDQWGLPAREAHKEALRYASHKDVVKMQLDELSEGIHKSVQKEPFLFSEYVKAHRDLTRTERDIESQGMTPEEANKAIEQAHALFKKSGGDPQKLKDSFRHFQLWTDKYILQSMADAGIISKKAAKDIKDNNKFYATYDVLEYQPRDINDIPTLRNKEYFSAANQDIIKAMKGTDKKIRDPMEATIDKMIRAQELAARNKVASALVDDPGFKKTLRPIASSKKEFAIMKNQGKDPIMHTDGRIKNPDYDTINRFKNGRVERYLVDAEIGHAMKQLPATRNLWRPVQIANNIFRKSATTLYVPFTISNIGRDFITGYTASPVYKGNPIDLAKYTGGVLKGVVKGWGHEFGGKSKTVEQYLKDGGGFGWVGENRSGKELLKSWKKTHPAELVLNPAQWLKQSANLIEKFASGVELGPRIANYEHALKRGAPNREAALIARTATIDFNKAGTALRVWNQWSPFLNARVQARNNLIRAVRRDISQGEYTNTLAKVTMVALLPGLATYAWNRVNYPDLFEDIPKWIRDNYFVFITGTAEGEDGRQEPEYYLMPKGDVGQMTMNPVEYGLDTMLKAGPKERESAMQFLTGFLSDLSPVPFADEEGQLSATKFMSGTVPPPLKAIAEPATNKDWYRNRPIEPEYMKDRRPELRKFDSTPKEYVALGEKLDLSPLVIQNVMGNLFAGMGRHGITGFKDALKGRLHRIQGGEIERKAWEDIDRLDQDYNYTRSDAVAAVENGNREKALELMREWNQEAEDRVQTFNKHFGEYGLRDRGGLSSKYKFTYQKIMNVMKSGSGPDRRPIEKRLTK